MELGFSPPVFLPCRLISTANCKNAATPLSPTLHKMEKKGRKKRWIGAESGRYSVNYSRPIFRPFDAARRIDTQRSSMRPNLASWRINWQTRRARSVLSLSLDLVEKESFEHRIEDWSTSLETFVPSFSSLSWSWDDESCCAFPSSSREYLELVELGRIHCEDTMKLCINIQRIWNFIYFFLGAAKDLYLIWSSIASEFKII